MNKLYIIIPIVGLLAFVAYYNQFNKGHEAKLEAAKLIVENERKAKVQQEIENREKAIQAAVEAQARRKLEREERDRLAEQKRVDRQTAEDQRARAFSDRNRLADQKRRLERELAEVQNEVKAVEAEKKTLLDEQVFLKDYIRLAEANVKYYYDLLDKIAQAEKARADAAAAAAAASKRG